MYGHVNVKIATVVVSFPFVVYYLVKSARLFVAVNLLYYVFHTHFSSACKTVN